MRLASFQYPQARSTWRPTSTAIGTPAIESGKVKADSNKIVWTSAPLPNDAIVLPKNAPADMGARVQKILTSITQEQAKTLLPPHYTGFIASSHDYYAPIEKAGVAVGKIKPKA